MSYSDLYNDAKLPTGASKAFALNWGLAVLLIAASCVGFLMLFSVADGNLDKWAFPQMVRFTMGFGMMIVMAFIPITIYRKLSFPIYIFALVLLIIVEFFGQVGMGAQRWIDLGFMRLQPSEFMKIALVMILAYYYSWIDKSLISKPQWLLPPIILTLLPVFLVLRQPDLGTAILLLAGAIVVMFIAGVSLWYFAAGLAAVGGLVFLVMYSQGHTWQLLKDYQYRRISTFLDPSSDPLGAGYHITQSKIALGSGGISGRGFMQGTQSHLNFLPEKHTDFIFTTLVEEFGFIGGMALLLIYLLIVLFCVVSAMTNANRFGAILTLGIAATFFFYFAVNMSMVMGLAPVVGVPLPLVSYGGSAMLVLMVGFGLVQSAHVHRPR
ncbi:MAG: rod shape-determining protein RodA [Rhodobacteraceae bacterium]|nr:MAG: rod shape-determining protein RodA [Paracoccaceae bacterium]